MASIPETLYTKAGVDAAIAAALAGFTGGGLGIVDNGDGTADITSVTPTTGGASVTVVDNGNGTYTTTYSPTGGTSSAVLIDNGDGTYIITA